MFNDASDEELSYCYGHAKMLVFASFVEGFGLPIIESLNNGLPVLASDIPIHREVGEDAIEYFDLNDAGDLANKIQYIEKNKISQKVDAKSVKTKTWKESSAELLGKVMKISDEISRNRNS
jgi:alpha-1,2-rhamnosyltransferase